MIPYLTTLGYSAQEKGYLLAMIAITTIVLQIVTGYLSDKLKMIKGIYIGIFLIFLVSSSLLFMHKSSLFIYYLLLVGIIGGCYRCSNGLLDSWMLQLDSERFSSLRAFGALGWASGSILLANILSIFGYGCIPLILGIVGCGSVIISFMVKDSERKQTKVQITDIVELVKNRKYMIFIAIVFLLYALGCADMYIVVDKILAIGGSSWEVGMKWGLQSLMEVPILLVGNRLLKKYGVYKLLYFASIMFLIRFLVYGYLQQANLFLYASIFQLVTFPIVVFCSKEEFEKLIDEKLKTSGQMFAMSLYMGASLFIMPIACSWLVEWVGFDVALYGVSCLAFFTILLLCIYQKL